MRVRLTPAAKGWKVAAGSARHEPAPAAAHSKTTRAPRVFKFSSIIPVDQPPVRLTTHRAWREGGGNCSGARRQDALLETSTRAALTAEEALAAEQKAYERSRLQMSKEQLFSMLQVFAFTRTAEEIHATQALELISGA